MADSLPGHSAIKETEEVSLFASGPDNNHNQFMQRATLDSTCVDSGNTPTTTLRGGFLVGLRSDGLSYIYDADATNGDQTPVGIVPRHTSMLDKDGTAEDKFSKLYTSGIIRNISDLTGVNADLYALSVLARLGFRFAQLEPHGSLFGVVWKREFKDGTALSGAYTVTSSDHGKLLVAYNAALNFTLPSLATVGRGFQVSFFNTVNANMVITGAANTIIYDDTTNGKATTLSFSTADNKMGASLTMTSDYDGAGTLSWYPTMIQRTVTAA